MSKHYETTITCPKCGKEAPFRIWESINTTLDPEMKEKVKDRSAFLFTCPNCSEVSHLQRDLSEQYSCVRRSNNGR